MESFNRSNGRSSNHGHCAESEENKEAVAFGAVEASWSSRLENLVREMNPSIGVEAIKNAVESNKFKAFEVFINESSIGFLIARIDTLADGSRQFVSLHSLSEVKGRTPLVMISSVLFEGLAKKYACTSICCFSDRPGWDGVLKRAGYEYRESIFIKKVEI